MKLEQLVSKDPDVHSGDLVFAGTRVPVFILTEALQQGLSLDEFMLDYPSVDRAQAEAFLAWSLHRAEADLDASADTGRSQRRPRANPA